MNDESIKPSPGDDSDTSSDSDVNLAKLKSAVDPDFQVLPKSNGIKSASSIEIQVKEVKKKSNRKVLSAEWEAGHFVHPLKLTSHSQEFVFKQLSEALDTKIKGVKKTIVQHEEADDGIYLFQSSSRRLSGKDLTRTERKNNKVIVQKKPKIKKRKLDSDGSSSDEDSKLKSVAVSSDWVLNAGSV